MSDLSWQGLHISHPGERERQNGEKSQVHAGVSTASGRVRMVELSREDLLRLIKDAGAFLYSMERKP